MPKPVELTVHARRVATERGLDVEWIERAANAPEWVAPDPDPSLERRFLTLPERGGRILRVVCAENDATIRIVSAFLDRRARRPP